ncbi:tankyrase-1 [Lingula anatina]|uniref:Tankyrase-1 n=1 Tax=Lingula anatina TaxID=7574 RepID=A0A1S3IR08_LINAN|nr:tankyrase-1 [Lingula anatina]|eukprot:XP_013399984.1 tankyrase-1 [Lingula anatina]
MEYLYTSVSAIGSVVTRVTNEVFRTIKDTEWTWVKDVQHSVEEGLRYTWTGVQSLTAEGVCFASVQYHTVKLYVNTNWPLWLAYIRGLLSLVFNQKTIVGFTCVVMILSILKIIYNVIMQVSTKLSMKRGKYYNINYSTMTIFDLAKTAYVKGHTEAVLDMLHRHNYDINYRLPANGLSLFLCACLSGEGKLIEYLLNHGADPSLLTEEGDSALYLATFGVLNTPQPDLTVLEMLIQEGCDVNHQNNKGYTSLHRAASRGNIEMIEYLLQQGADVNLFSKSGVYPMDSAVNAGHLDAAELLKTDLPETYVTQRVDDLFTPPRIQMGLQSPCKTHLVESNVRRRSVQL